VSSVDTVVNYDVTMKLTNRLISCSFMPFSFWMNTSRLKKLHNVDFKISCI